MPSARYGPITLTKKHVELTKIKGLMKGRCLCMLNVRRWNCPLYCICMYVLSITKIAGLNSLPNNYVWAKGLVWFSINFSLEIWLNPKVFGTNVCIRFFSGCSNCLVDRIFSYIKTVVKSLLDTPDCIFVKKMH